MTLTAEEKRVLLWCVRTEIAAFEGEIAAKGGSADEARERHLRTLRNAERKVEECTVA